MLTRIASFTAGLLLFTGSAFAAPAVWTFDSSHSAAHFSIKHMVFSTVRGEFGALTGTVNYDSADVSKTTIDASIDATTINTRDAKRDGHLKSPDFFDVAKFPTLTFKSKSLAKKGDRFALTGDLTIHGVTKSVTFDVAPLSPELTNPWGQSVISTTATAKVNRKDFGLLWNKPLQKAGQFLVGDDVEIQLDLEFNKKAPESAKK